jgi:hypothetical protein
VPQADMLECRLEILLIVPHPNKTCTFEYAAPNERGQYNNVLANDTYLVAIVKRLYYMTFGWWISLAKLHKANFILQFFAIVSFKNLVYKGRNNPHTLHVN